MMRTSHFRTLLAGAALASLASPAFALDGADLLAKLNATYATSGVTISSSNVAVDGSTVTLDSAELKATGSEAPVKLGTITMDGVEEDGEGGYTVETVSFQDINVTEADATVSAKDIAINGVIIPGTVVPGTLESLLMYESATAGPVSVTSKGKEVFSMSGMEANIKRMDADAGLEFDATLSDLKADLTSVEDPKAKDTLAKLNMQTLEGKVSMSGSWELASGKLAVDEYAFDFKDVGRLNLALEFSGYTLDFLKSMQEAIKAAEANPNKEEANAAMGMSMMGLVQQLTFNSASISFEDASITKKLLDYAGSEQGVSGDQMAQSLKGLIPIMLAQLNMPDLQNQIAEAANAYLDDPKSITISAEPKEPVPFPMIMGAAMGAPQTIPQVLGVTVTANDEM
ncbi:MULTISPECIES: hypothetical protein [unclassified Shinella]|jgi:hypothetical protein|uniref:hypothetical protein n=1 Tax=unclassified Shinella TaxID=2643062 RepID=UPI0003C55289|nr:MULTISPECIES: hypothetical protein [unclassified Shinella]MCA0341071.1 hypothetical protein [Pseudomonadota bacterium]EYR80680.1 putative transmembrane protein [Shinella sp. DD12]KNY18181.1 membrane protein [Shinella sp. SUS2]KOC77376.1 hypothetical protein AKG10_00765 [Shinella sp. GWS1]MCO5154206.1 hypothetical protein [Shinella sp.]